MSRGTRVRKKILAALNTVCDSRETHPQFPGAPGSEGSITKKFHIELFPLHSEALGPTSSVTVLAHGIVLLPVSSYLGYLCFE